MSLGKRNGSFDEILEQVGLFQGDVDAVRDGKRENGVSKGSGREAGGRRSRLPVSSSLIRRLRACVICCVRMRGFLGILIACRS